ncbi:hypothetical protein AVEN_219200-1 [Araneus ventricosus]|uniref:Uncharacterized protein n=1 Tax=Araneus ventricosus TaxID=182803 RepID=A0A4Y2HVV5_ARAVE|nr:hypothetical protein AVEN_219200-1 [Araneus ventricosus]
MLLGYHGTVGPLTAERPKYQAGPILELSQKLGLKVVDSNAARQTGNSVNTTNIVADYSYEMPNMREDTGFVL